MSTIPNDRKSGRIHVAAIFNESGIEGYNRDEMREYVDVMLSDKDILHSSIVMMEKGDGTVIVQVKMDKATIDSKTLNKVESILSAMDGFKEMFVLTESVMKHPEIYNRDT